ncbi:hypothetical protein B0H67DRAFT_157739 [Lasiosphaeris hirsuta]|uniref:Uncharacterized protein n=1 Tax=Lasiosphaeris hirsuta TaxID=260670 RepID=A0AA40APK5_9PEZI|nr:hypothetical protein B0H67DRAFT_157739 [Lasiosphaeris hirsuta]
MPCQISPCESSLSWVGAPMVAPSPHPHPLALTHEESRRRLARPIKLDGRLCLACESSFCDPSAHTRLSRWVLVFHPPPSTCRLRRGVISLRAHLSGTSWKLGRRTGLGRFGFHCAVAALEPSGHFVIPQPTSETVDSKLSRNPRSRRLLHCCSADCVRVWTHQLHLYLGTVTPPRLAPHGITVLPSAPQLNPSKLGAKLKTAFLPTLSNLLFFLSAVCDSA